MTGHSLAGGDPAGRSVSVYPILYEKKHRPLSDLTAADLSVSDNGSPIDSRELRVSAKDQGDRRLITLIFDRLSPMHTRSAVQAATTVLKEIPVPTGEIGVWTVDDQLRIAQAYTRDRALVSTAVKSFAARSSLPENPVLARAGAVQPAANGQHSPDEISRWSLDAARSLVNGGHLPWGLAALVAAAGSERELPAGQTVARFEQEFQRQGEIDAEKSLRSEYFSLTRPVLLPFGKYSLHVIVRDWNSGRTGRSLSEITPAALKGGNTLSDLVLVRSTREAGGAAAMPYGDLEVVPNLSGASRADADGISLYFEEHSSSDQPQTLSLEIQKDGRPAKTLPLAVTPDAAVGTSARIAHVLLGNTPGKYQFVLCLETAGRTVRRILSVNTQDISAGREGQSAAAEKLALDEKAQTEAAVAAKVQAFGLELKEVQGSFLSQSGQGALIVDARQHALNYTDLLPNFVCLETIERSKDSKDDGQWKHMDTIVERLRYQQKTEDRSVVMMNGEKTRMTVDSIEGARSNGEFGGILQAIFDPAVHAQFRWEKSVETDGETLQVFSFPVARKDSSYFVNEPGDAQVRAEFTGYVYIDSDTRVVRRLLASTEELPVDFPIRATWIALRYNYLAINDHQYLVLPTVRSDCCTESTGRI